MRVLWPNQQPVARAGKRWRAAVFTFSGTRVDRRESFENRARAEPMRAGKTLESSSFYACR